MIIFNDSISKLYQCSIWGFCRGICIFFSICLGIKDAEIIKILGISKKHASKNKIYFISRKKSNLSLNKKVIFVFHTIFKLDFIIQIFYCIIERCLCSHLILFLFSYISLYEMEQRNNVNFSLFMQLAKVSNNKMNEKRSQEYQSMDPEYVTELWITRILEFLLKRFCCLVFAPLSQKP